MTTLRNDSSSALDHRARVFAVLAVVAATALSFAQGPQPREWLAGDSHIHSHWSPAYDRTKTPPEPLKGMDAIYPTPLNAQKAREYGLSWMVTTDHGGPNHSKFNLVHAYAELNEARAQVPDVLQFYGMELNMPAMDHHTVILPYADDEWKTLFNIESQFDANDAWPPDPARNSEAAGLRALAFMSALPRLPLVFANHPSRSATAVGQYGLDEPREFRNNNDAAPQVYRGMEGAPGHQAGTLAPDGSIRRDAAGQPAGSRGSYSNDNARTFGGFDQMTAIVGGLWDAMLGEGRRFWIVATSDSHANFADAEKPGSDFWPGQYQKTYVHARKRYDDILDGLRLGRIFAVAGDLVSTLSIVAEADGETAESGATLTVRRGANVRLTIRFRDPAMPNANGEDPRVARLDVIAGDVSVPDANRNADRNATTKVVARYTSREWTTTGDERTTTTIFPSVRQSFYARARGTSTSELEPSMDPQGENPWTDLWMYSNPVFVMVQ